MRNLLIGCVLALSASSAFAATDSIELQINSDRLLPLIEDRAKGSVGCFPTFLAAGTTMVIDHVEFPSPPTFRRSPTMLPVTVNSTTTFSGRALQVAMPIKTFVKTQAQLNDPNVGQETYLAVSTASVIFNLAITSPSGTTTLCATPSTIEPTFTGSSQLLSALQTQIGTQCFPMQLDGLTDILAGQATLTGTGLSASADLSKVAIRLEFDRPTPNVTAWRNFVDNGALTNINTASGFGVSFDTGLLGRVLRRRFSDRMTDPSMEIVKPLSVAWPWPAPLATMTMEGDLDVPVCLNDIGFDVDGSLAFTLNAAGDQITMNGSIGLSPHAGDVTLCALTSLGATGLLFLAFDPVLIGVSADLMSNIGIPGDQLPNECHKTGDETLSCNFPVVMPTLVAGGGSNLTVPLHAQSLTKVGSELVITGNGSVTGFKRTLPRAFIGDITMSYGVHGKCSSLHTGTEGVFKAQGTGALCSSQMSIAGDTLNAFFAPYLDEVHAAPWEKTISFGGTNTTAYFAAPYAAKITARTAGGGRTVKVGPVAEPSAADQQEAAYERVDAKVRCMKLETGWHGIPGMFDPHWHVDPPYDLVAQVRSNDPVLARNPTRVTLEDVSFEMVGRTTRPLGTRFSLSQQDVKISAIAIVNFGARLGTVKVPVSTIVRGNLAGKEVGETGFVKTSFAQGQTAQFQISSSYFPRGVAGVDVAVDISPRNLALQGDLAGR